VAPGAVEILAAAIAMLAATAVAVAVDMAAVVVAMAVNARVVVVVVAAAMVHVGRAVPAALLAGKTCPTNTRRLCPDSLP
jgi:hypothetical protein